MKKEILVFGKNLIDKHKFHYSENTILINNVDNVDIHKILISNKVSFGKKIYKYSIDCMFLSCQVRVSEWIHAL